MVASLFLEFILLGVVVFTLKLQKPVLSSTSKEDKDSEENSKKQRWSKKSPLIVCFACCSRNSNCEWNNGRFCGTCRQKLGLTELFIGVGSTIVGIVGNAAEHSSAITFATFVLTRKMN